MPTPSFSSSLHNGTYRTRYLFNGKELDTETNLYYYGARYFEPKEILWYGVDPLAEKYPFNSGYVYCSANPVMRIDPDGRDEFEVNDEGYVVKRIKTKEHDAFYMVDANGKRTGRYTEFDYGTVKSYREVKDIEYEGKTYNLTLFDINGDDNAQELFEFFADNYGMLNVPDSWENKGPEWSHTKIGEENSGRNVVGTAHDPARNLVCGYLFANGYTVRSDSHSHPSGTPVPSQADKHFAETFKNRTLELYIYTPIYTKYPGYYTKYDENGVIERK